MTDCLRFQVGSSAQGHLKTLWQRSAENCHDFHLLENGNILCLTSWTSVIEVTRSNDVVWEYDAATANGNDAFGKVEVHGIQRLYETYPFSIKLRIH